MRAELLLDCRCTIGEGPVWDRESGDLYFVDLLQNAVHRRRPGRPLESVRLGQNVGCVALREGGGMVAAMQHGFYLLSFGQGELTFLSDPEAHLPDSRFNDGKCDPAGRLWAGTMSKKLDGGSGEKCAGSALYCLDHDLRVHRRLEGVIQSNGMGWSPDGERMYFIDTQRMSVQAFDFDMASGELSGGKVCVLIPEGAGIPDGMTVDDEGMLWVALWGGGCVQRYDPATGAPLQRIRLPVPKVTSCAFGDGDGRTLYITTAALDTDPDRYPGAGGVFVVRPGVSGPPAYRFRG